MLIFLPILNVRSNDWLIIKVKEHVRHQSQQKLFWSFKQPDCHILLFLFCFLPELGVLCCDNAHLELRGLEINGENS